ncbi:hypothetical protein [Actinomyces respiraculi]|uniref:hypothetical protein n=1 Tax=Actinomyces respiraculi TaxID=2744574 RepID=UPI001F447BA6|nr:hypothetical protein [Actinomyces respiraculi]
MTTNMTTTPTAPAVSTTRLRRVRPLLTFLMLEQLRALRHPANLFFVIAFPSAMYLMFNNVGGIGTQQVGEHGNVSATVMLAMASFSACMAATSSATGAAIELQVGWGRQIAVTAGGMRIYWAVKVATAFVQATVPVLVIFLAGALTTAELDARGWVLGFLLAVVTVIPFILWGLGMGLLLPSQAAMGIAPAFVSLFGFLGNAFMPLNETMMTIARFTPLYGPVALVRWPMTEGWTYVTDLPAPVQDEMWMAVANLVAWTVLFALPVVALRRRATVRQ